jgi:hypothetical protein
LGNNAINNVTDEQPADDELFVGRDECTEQAAGRYSDWSDTQEIDDHGKEFGQKSGTSGKLCLSNTLDSCYQLQVYCVRKAIWFVVKVMDFMISNHCMG